MAKNNKLMWKIIAWSLWLISGAALVYATIQRTMNGISSYYSNPTWVILGTISYAIFLGTTMGLVVSVIVNRAK